MGNDAARSERRLTTASREDGLSVVEALVSLAILSLVMLIGGRVLAVQAAIGSRAAQVAEAAMSEPSGITMFQHVTAHTIPAWPEEDATFEGLPHAIGGLTARPLHLKEPRLSPYALRLDRSPSGTIRVRYRSGGTDWIVGEIDGSTATLTYLGADGTWYERWPPDRNPAVGPFGEADLFDTPQLPLAVRLSGEDEAWIGALRHRHALPGRVRDL